MSFAARSKAADADTSANADTGEGAATPDDTAESIDHAAALPAVKVPAQEIAFAIMAEMLSAKNKGNGASCKTITDKFLTGNCESMKKPMGTDGQVKA